MARWDSRFLVVAFAETGLGAPWMGRAKSPTRSTVRPGSRFGGICQRAVRSSGVWVRGIDGLDEGRIGGAGRAGGWFPMVLSVPVRGMDNDLFRLEGD